MNVLDFINYWIAMFLLIAGIYIVIARGNLVKKLVGLSIFQTSVYLIYISPSKILGATAPILAADFSLYSNPLPHVLILTAIVVGVATTSLGLALIVRIGGARDEPRDLHADRHDRAHFRDGRRPRVRQALGHHRARPGSGGAHS